ncbi:hypothetical protein U3516DRAFT_764403 [Neocallimastix sp. 'constans']
MKEYYNMIIQKRGFVNESEQESIDNLGTATPQHLSLLIIEYPLTHLDKVLNFDPNTPVPTTPNFTELAFLLISIYVYTTSSSSFSSSHSVGRERQSIMINSTFEQTTTNNIFILHSSFFIFIHIQSIAKTKNVFSPVDLFMRDNPSFYLVIFISIFDPTKNNHKYPDRNQNPVNSSTKQLFRGVNEKVDKALSTIQKAQRLLLGNKKLRDFWKTNICNAKKSPIVICVWIVNAYGKVTV